MTVIITGICGFIGCALALELPRRVAGMKIIGLDNLSRPGSEQNRYLLQKKGVAFVHGDVRNPSDLESLPWADWVIDAAANPSVLAGFEGTNSRQIMEHNLIGTLNLLEYCKRQAAGIVMLSTSRVYALEPLSAMPMEVKDDAFEPRWSDVKEPGVTPEGVSERFSTRAPISLYGATKLASEALVLEYSMAFGFPAHINRCGVLAGAGQFGKADQGIFSFWIHSFCGKKPVKYIGFGGKGQQVRDCLHPADLADLIERQLVHPEKAGGIVNVSGGRKNSMSLAQLSRWCKERFGDHRIGSEPTGRRFDVPWIVLDSARAEAEWQWQPSKRLEDILEEIARHAEQNPGWLEISQAS